MWKNLAAGIAIVCASAGVAQATCPVTYTFANGATADATQVNQDFSDLTSCVAPLASPHFTGTVGIGTASPTLGILQAEGNIAAHVGNNANAFTGRNSANSNQYFYNVYTDTSGNGIVNVLDNAGTVRVFLAGSGASYFTGGNVGIATTSPSYTLHVNGSVAGTSAYNNLSDKRLKKSVEPIDDALSIISRIQGVRFRWRSVAERSVGKELSLPVDEPQVGFIAQDLRQALPEAVTVAQGDAAIMSVEESKLSPVLVEAVKELKSENEKQANEITNLSGKLLALQRELDSRVAAR